MNDDIYPGLPAKLKSRRPLLICFVGIDGAGKSTHATNLLQWMREQGCPVKYVWNRYDPWLLKPVMWVGRKTFLRNQDMFKNYRDYQKKKKQVLKIPVLNQIFLSAYLMEYLVRTFLKIKFLLVQGNSVICDRYYFDILAGVSADNNYPVEKTLYLFELMNKILPRPDKIFLLMVSEEIAFRRKDDIPSIEFLTEKQQIYQNLSKPCKMDIIDGQQDIRKISEYIQDQISRIPKISE